VDFLRDVEGDFDLLAAFGSIKTPFVFIQPIAVVHIRSCSAASTNVAILTVSTFPFQMWIAERIENIGLFPEVNETGIPDIPGGKGHVRAWCEITVGGDAGIIGPG